jgi:hypothetical protein
MMSMPTNEKIVTKKSLKRRNRSNKKRKTWQ